MAATERVLLVGLMGSGKSTVARVVARRLSRPLLDNDALVDAARGAKLEELRRREGGAGLHVAESAALAAVLVDPGPFVASAAASVIDSARNRALLVATDVFVVWLRADVATLTERLAGDRERPWLGGDRTRTLARMVAERDPLFGEVADLTLDAAASPDELAEAIVDAVRGSGAA